MSSPYKEYVETTQKKKIKQATKSKSSRPALNTLLGPSKRRTKRRERRVCQDPALSDTPSDSDTDLAVSFTDDQMEEDEEQDADCVFCAGRFSEDHSGEDQIRCAKCFRWANTRCAGVEEDFVCEPCQG